MCDNSITFEALLVQAVSFVLDIFLWFFLSAADVQVAVLGGVKASGLKLESGDWCWFTLEPPGWDHLGT